MKHLATYAKLRAELPQAIRDARTAGHTWESIAATAGMTRQAIVNASKR